MRVLILGGAGMLGHKLCQLYRDRFDTYATLRSGKEGFARYGLLEADRLVDRVDAAQFDTVVRAVAEVRPQAVINCIGIVKQLPEANDPLLSLSINALFPRRLAQLCGAAGARLVHISTDCVFSGRKGRYTEDDTADADDLYGRTKYLGEVDGPGCLTLRTSIVGRELNTRLGLIEWLLANRGKAVRGFRRAIYTGLTTGALGELIAELLRRDPPLCGLRHVSSEPITKHDLLCLVNEVFGLAVRIDPDDAFSCDRSLNSSRFRRETGFQPASWPEMIRQMYQDLFRYDDWRSK